MPHTTKPTATFNSFLSSVPVADAIAQADALESAWRDHELREYRAAIYREVAQRVLAVKSQRELVALAAALELAALL